MATEIIMPVLGMTMESGIIVEWMKEEGDSVTEGEVLFNVETDKSVMEVEAKASGTLLKIVHGPGDDVPIQQVIGYIGEAGETVGEAGDADDPGDGGASAATAARQPTPQRTPLRTAPPVARMSRPQPAPDNPDHPDRQAARPARPARPRQDFPEGAETRPRPRRRHRANRRDGPRRADRVLRRGGLRGPVRRSGTSSPSGPGHSPPGGPGSRNGPGRSGPGFETGPAPRPARRAAQDRRDATGRKRVDHSPLLPHHGRGHDPPHRATGTADRLW